MLKTKKRYLLIAIVTIVAMIVSGLSLILSANTNISASPNVNVTAMGENYGYWTSWTAGSQGDMGDFHYQFFNDGENENNNAVVFTGSGALNLTYDAVCNMLGVENLNGHDLYDVFDYSWDDVWCWNRDYFLVVGEGITSVSMDYEGGSDGPMFVFLSSTVESFVNVNDCICYDGARISVKTDANGNFALKSISRSAFLFQSYHYEWDEPGASIDSQINTSVGWNSWNVGVNGTVTGSSGDYSYSGDCLYYGALYLETPTGTVAKTVLLGDLTEFEGETVGADHYPTLTSINLRDDCVLIANGAVIPANITSVKLPNDGETVEKTSSVETDWDVLFAMVNGTPMPGSTPETGIVADLSITIGSIVLLGAVLVVLNKKKEQF